MPKKKTHPPKNGMTPDQYELNFSAAWQAGMDGLEQAESAAADDERELMYRAVLAAARKHQLFTADDVWQEMDRAAVLHASAMGGALKRAKAAGCIGWTGDFRRSSRVPTHTRPLPVWRSCLTE